MRNALAGMYRSGTTAFMLGCGAGGMRLVLPPAERTTEDDRTWRDMQVARRHLEPTAKMVHEHLYPLVYDDESVSKMLWPNLEPELHRMVAALHPDPDNGYRIAFIWRHPWEIRKAIENDFDWSFREGARAEASVPWLTNGHEYKGRMLKMLDHFRIRRDVHSIYELQYRSNYRPDLPSLEHDALDIYKDLAELGWQVDPVKAAEAINVADNCRWRAEDIPEAREAA